jgi:hypothetical protein
MLCIICASRLQIVSRLLVLTKISGSPSNWRIHIQGGDAHRRMYISLMDEMYLPLLKFIYLERSIIVKKKYVTLMIVVIMLVTASVASASSTNFVAPLNGGEEVPPRDTNARGVATFKLSSDGTGLDFKVNVANIENVFAAHIHCGAVGVNGPVGVTLFSGTLGGGRIEGTLAEGTITVPDPGNGCGWADLDAVLAAIASGNTYVNVHTNDGVAPPNTGPGDFPGGEIRGQVK